MSERAVVLLSGGMDSAVVLAELRRRRFECLAISFDYGQRHRVELLAAARVAAALGAAEHVVSSVDLRAFGGSALTSEIPVPKDRPLGDAAPGEGIERRPAPGAPAARGSRAVGAAHESIPITYVPARNTVFLSQALALAEARGARHIGIGVNAIDYSGYPDCRPEFVDAFERLANLATREGVEARERGEQWLRVHAPLVLMSKGDIVRRGLELGVDFGITFSCYDPIPAPGEAPYGVRACGHCDACLLRARGFAEAGVCAPPG